MTINYKLARKYLEAFDFQNLFTEVLGWGHSVRKQMVLTVDGVPYRLTPIAELGDMVVFQCEPQGADSTGTMPGIPMPARSKIGRQVSKIAFEHILIFTDKGHTKATWHWVKRGQGSARTRTHTYTKGQSGESLLQRLAGIAFKLEELDDDGRVAIGVVTGKVTKAFDVEKVTKRFYEEFKGQHADFAKFLRGIPQADDRAWYVSVMLNRLMFIYFIQKKAFLDGDPNYLQNRLEASKARGKDRFYRDFLRTLFFEGFAQDVSERSAETKKLLGKVPYLNGGLFMPHEIEQTYGKAVDIADAAFERIFAFFDKYTWHLDDRPLRNDNEINPDVLGYIFEKYINQKQMGAYYTKEDITGYICRNTILPRLFDMLADHRYDAVHPLPMADVEPYIYEAVKQAEHLPTETEREYAARQKRLAGIRSDFAAGKIASINDLITYNLDIEAFAQDWLAELDDPVALRAFYFHCLKKISVLDPTCGSGAFLFAALNILEPLYEICLDRMAELAGPKYDDFAAELKLVAQRPNRAYFIYKSIIVQNLYGVDIMPEAVEICRLRLFLKLVAQVEPGGKIEPLPDIDFNILAGNTLVGYATEEQIKAAGAYGSLFNLDIEQQVTEVARELAAFRDLQTRLDTGPGVMAKAKQGVREKLRELENVLDVALANEYKMEVDHFVSSHQPLHWFAHFYSIINDGGFDVVVGNPPYIVYSASKVDYALPARIYKTLSSRNLYGFVIERALELAKSTSAVSFIVQLTVLSSEFMSVLQNLLSERGPLVALSFPRRPESIFDGVEMPVAILVSLPLAEGRYITSSVRRFYSEERPWALPLTKLQSHDLRLDGYRIAKISSVAEQRIAGKVGGCRERVERILRGSSEWPVYYQEACRYWAKAMSGLPRFKRNGSEVPPPHGRTLGVESREGAAFVACLLNSSLFYWYYSAFADCEHVNDRLVRGFPIPSTWREDSWQQLWSELSADLQKHAQPKTIYTKQGHTIEYDELNVSTSKSIIDKIDRILAKHYGFTDEELDFIINYDIKYRMGKGADDGAAGDDEE